MLLLFSIFRKTQTARVSCHRPPSHHQPSLLTDRSRRSGKLQTKQSNNKPTKRTQNNQVNIMGLLKHVILPLLTLLDCVFVMNFVIKEEIDEDMSKTWDCPAGTPSDSPITVHFMHLIGALGLLMAINNIAAILYGNGFHRAMACAQHGILFIVDSWSYVHLGKDIPGIVYVILAIVSIGLAVHSQEPGVFTKDKKDKKN